MEDPIDYSREVQHDPDSFFTSTGKPLWDRVMSQGSICFDDIGVDDLIGELSLKLMGEFVSRCVSSPPVSLRTKKPFGAKTLQDTVSTVARKLKSRFANELKDRPDIFPVDDINKLRSRIKDGRNRVMMEGDEESDVLKDTFPLPKQHSDRTNMHSGDNFRDEAQRTQSRSTDLTSLAKKLFSSGKFEELAVLLFTFYGVGRGGEVKFLSYASFFFDEKFNMLFAQWFQRKNLKTNPSGFVPDFEFAETCLFLILGCFWACDGGLERPDGVGEPKTPLGRKARFVFQNLHKIQDRSVAKELNRIIRLGIHEAISAFFSGKSLRIGAMTHLAWDPAVTYEEAVALGGWSTPSNADWHMWIYLTAVIPPALSLAGCHSSAATGVQAILCWREGGIANQRAIPSLCFSFVPL